MEKENQKKELSIQKATYLCSIIAGAICLIAIGIEWWTINFVDKIWVILLVVNILLILVNLFWNKKQ